MFTHVGWAILSIQHRILWKISSSSFREPPFEVERFHTVLFLSDKFIFLYFGRPPAGTWPLFNGALPHYILTPYNNGNRPSLLPRSLSICCVNSRRAKQQHRRVPFSLLNPAAGGWGWTRCVCLPVSFTFFENTIPGMLSPLRHHSPYSSRYLYFFFSLSLSYSLSLFRLCHWAPFIGYYERNYLGGGLPVN